MLQLISSFSSLQIFRMGPCSSTTDTPIPLPQKCTCTCMPPF
jgi:hypothetical protein